MPWMQRVGRRLAPMSAAEALDNHIFVSQNPLAHINNLIKWLNVLYFREAQVRAGIEFLQKYIQLFLRPCRLPDILHFMASSWK